MKDTAISAVNPCLAFDSRGTPTVACEVRLTGGGVGSVVVPSGASTGTGEAVELRDGGRPFGGRGVRDAIANVERVIAPALQGRDAADAEALDTVMEELDGTTSLGRLGANAILAVSLAAALAAAKQARVPAYRWFGAGRDPLVPVPMVNILSGGAHAGGALDIQDFLVVPLGVPDFAAAIERVWDVREGTRQALHEAGYRADLVADEGGFGEPLPSHVDALELLCLGIERAGLRPGDDVGIALDIAANQFAVDGGYRFAAEDRMLTADELVAEIAQWATRYPIVSVEDVLSDQDWAGWRRATDVLGSRQLLGDDLFVTTADLLRRGIEEGVANAVLVKPNQAGTLTRTRRVVELAQSSGFATVLSARSGETEDSWLADLAVGWRTGQIKVGSLTRSERLAKWNRLLRIESELGSAAEYAGVSGAPGLTVGAP